MKFWSALGAGFLSTGKRRSNVSGAGGFCDSTYQSLQLKLQGLLAGLEQHDALLLPVSLSQELLPALALPLQLPLALQLTFGSLEHTENVSL